MTAFVHLLPQPRRHADQLPARPPAQTVWTVEMLLIFTLGRLDVLPVDDFGIREGLRHAYGRRSRPTPRALRAHGERWKPYRSIAAWYLWRAASDARQAAK